MNTEDEAGVGLAVHWIQLALISAYEDNCSLRQVRRGRKCLRWTLELESLRREVRRLFNRCWANNNSHSWEFYREAQRRYRKEVRKASKETRRTFCSSINDLPKTARLHRALSRDPKIRLGSLVAPSGVYAIRRGNPGSRACYSLPQFICYGEGSDTCRCLPYQMFRLAGGCEDCYLLKSGMGN